MSLKQKHTTGIIGAWCISTIASRDNKYPVISAQKPEFGKLSLDCLAPHQSVVRHVTQQLVTSRSELSLV